MNLRVCSEKFFDDKFDFFELLKVVRMDNIVAVRKFTDYSHIEIFDYFAESFSDKFVQLKKHRRLLSPDTVGNAIAGLSVCKNDNMDLVARL